MRDIVIYGAGGMAKETVQLIEDINIVTPVWRIVGFIDDFAEPGSLKDDMNILGNAGVLKDFRERANVAIAIGDPAGRRRIFEKINTYNVEFPTLIHPTAKICRNATVGLGTIIGIDCILSVNVRVGNHVFLNTRTVLGHDVIVGDFSSCLVNCLVSGSVSIGEEALLGSNCVVMEKKKIGTGARVSMGAVVDSDVENYHVVMNRPSKSMFFGN